MLIISLIIVGCGQLAGWLKQHKASINPSFHVRPVTPVWYQQFPQAAFTFA